MKKRITITILITILTIFTVLIFTTNNKPANASSSNNIDNSKQNEIQVPVSKANNDKPIDSFVKKENLIIYKNKDKLPKDATKLKEELLSYKEFNQKYETNQGQGQINDNRMVWVVQIYFPSGYQLKRGFVKNAITTLVYDAETGEFLGQIVKTLDSDGMKDIKHFQS